MINVIKKQYHWVVLFCCCLMIGGSLGLTANAYAVMYTPLCTALVVGRGQIMLHSTISNIVLGLATPFVVKLISKIKLRYIFIAGLLLVESSLFVTAFSGSLLLINIFGVIRGVGLACVYIAIVTIVLGNWFVKAGGTAIGFSLSFSGFAGAVFGPILSSYVEAHGYQQGFVLMAILFACMVIPGIIFIKFTPEELGREAYGYENKPVKKEDGENKINSYYKNTGLSPILISMIIFCIFGASIACIGQHISGYADSLGLATSIGALMLSASMIGNISFKFINGVLVDVFGAIKATIVIIVLTAIGVIMLLLFSQKWVLLSASFLFGASFALSAASAPVVLKQIYGPINYRSIYSKMTTITQISYAVFLSAAGFLYDFSGSYLPVFLGVIVFCVISMASMVFIDITLKKNI